MLNTEAIIQTVEVLEALTKRVIAKYQQRSCFACREDLPLLLETDHLCMSQSPSELVDLYFDNAYETVSANLLNAVFVLDGDKIPATSLDSVKEHFKDEMREKLARHMDFINHGELKITRALGYLSPLFVSMS